MTNFYWGKTCESDRYVAVHSREECRVLARLNGVAIEPRLISIDSFTMQSWLNTWHCAGCDQPLRSEGA